MTLQPPSLSRAETRPQGGPAFKAEAGRRFHPGFTSTTDAFKNDSIRFIPQYPGNLQVELGGKSLLASAAFRITESADVFFQGEISRAAGILSSAWLLGLRSEMNPEGFSPFLEGGIGMLDVYVHTVIEKYQEAGLFFPEEREYLGSERIDEYRFVPFPHFGGGIRTRFGSRLHLLAKARTLLVYDVHKVGVDTFLNSAGVEAELAVSRHLSLHALAEILSSTLPGRRLSETVGLGFTFRPW